MDVRGLQFHTVSATLTLVRTLRQLMVHITSALRPRIQVNLHGRLVTGFTAASALGASLVQSSNATYICPLGRQPTKPGQTGTQLTSSTLELEAGARQFFGALQVEPRALVPPASSLVALGRTAYYYYGSAD